MPPQVELGVAVAAADLRAAGSRSGLKALQAASAPLRLCLGALLELLRAVWPRAAAHAPLVTRHVLTVFVRTSALAQRAAADGGVDGADDTAQERGSSHPLTPLLPECGALMRLLSEVGGSAPLEQTAAALRPTLQREPPLERALDALLAAARFEASAAS